MCVSTRPLLRGKVLAFTEISNYKDLLALHSDPMTDLYVGHIRIVVDDLTSKPYLNVRLNGKPHLTDFLMLVETVTIDFGRNVLLNRSDKPLVIQMKKAAAGAGDLTATVFVDGVEEPKY